MVTLSAGVPRLSNDYRSYLIISSRGIKMLTYSTTFASKRFAGSIDRSTKSTFEDRIMLLFGFKRR